MAYLNKAQYDYRREAAAARNLAPYWTIKNNVIWITTKCSISAQTGVMNVSPLLFIMMGTYRHSTLNTKYVKN